MYLIEFEKMRRHLSGWVDRGEGDSLEKEKVGVPYTCVQGMTVMTGA